ncbi:MAG: carbohydrate kinase family protein [Candidatus Nomurabacteria bacterium]|nr:MAG: carbohydrate kinase family protein [Candidatus Nomurabacteria bacterium]
MTHTLKQLLGNDHPLFVANLVALEKAVGNDGVDAKLLGDIIERGHEVLRSVGLDPADTTGVEAYRALSNIAGNEASRGKLRDTDFVLLLFGDDLVSFNLHDIIENSHHQLKFENRVLGHAQRHLRAEIVRRYAEHDRSNNELVHELAHEIGLKPESDEGHHDIHKEVSKDMSQQVPRVLAVGDIFTDAFIKLNEEVARVDTDPDGSKRISLPLGNKPPYDGVDIVRAVGPSPNAAVSMARLGLEPSLLAFMGDDQVAIDAREYLKSEGVSDELLSLQEGQKSSYYYVLRYGAERTILVKNEDYDYVWKEPTEEPAWIYLSLLSDKSWKLHEDMLKYLHDHPNVKFAFQPGTFHFKWGVEKLKDFYSRSHIVVLNREEAMDITGKPHDPIGELTKAVHDLGPQIVVITDGPNGSFASYDWKLVTIPNYPDPGPPVDRTGAGDAFASTIVAALALGESMDTALTWAPINSMSVVQQIGAQTGLLSREKIMEYLKNAPEDYRVTEIKE